MPAQSVGVVHNPYGISNGAGHDLTHFSGKRAGVANGRTFLNTGREDNGVGAAFNEFLSAEHDFFAGTAAAGNEARDIDVLFNTLECPFSFAHHLEIRAARAEIFCLHASDNADVHYFLHQACHIR